MGHGFYGISIHALREEGDKETIMSSLKVQISIHALREEGDHGRGSRLYEFMISIHALREEGDLCSEVVAAFDIYFYPRPPRGGRQSNTEGIRIRCPFLSTPSARRATRKIERILRTKLFLSTPSARRATGHHQPSQHGRGISIHALREEGDGLGVRFAVDAANFYPRPPRGGRRELPQNVVVTFRFLSTPSARRATRPERGHCPCCQISIHALREEGDAFHIAVP